MMAVLPTISDLMSRETDYKERTIDDAIDVIDNSIVI
jgi:hypothetical protein